MTVRKLCDQARGQHIAVTCFCFDLATYKEQTATSMLSSFLKQRVSRNGEILEDIWQSLRERGEAISGRRPQLGDAVKILQLITPPEPIFIVIEALDKCTAVQRLGFSIG